MIRVTVEDLSGNDPPEVTEIENDYVLVCAGSAEVTSTQIYRSGETHVITVKGRKDGVRS